MAAPQLPPFPRQIALFPQFIAQKSETLVLKEKVMSLSGDSFEIKNIDGLALFQVGGNAISLSGRKKVSDMQGNHLFDIRKKHIALQATYYAEDPSGKEIFQVVGKFSIGSSKSYGRFTSAGGKQEELLMKGDFFDRQADIIDEETKQAVAKIDRQFLNMREVFGKQQTYALTVAPGVDMALMVAMCICLDERRNEK